MKCQILFSGKIRKISSILLSADLAPRVIKVKRIHYISAAEFLLLLVDNYAMTNIIA